VGRPRDVALDQRILDATVALLSERGFEHTTMDDVARQAGVAKATVYRRYAAKEDLAFAAVSRLFDTEIPVPDTGSFRGDLERMYANALSVAAGPLGQALIRLGASESCREPRVAALYRRWIENRRAQCDPLFDRAIARGEMRADAPRGAVFDWVTGLLLLHAVLREDPIQPAAAFDLVHLTLCGAEPRN
jgi:AcrR family transcriptional regulator